LSGSQTVFVNDIGDRCGRISNEVSRITRTTSASDQTLPLKKESAQARAIYEHAQGLTQLFQNCSISNNEISISIIEKCRDPQITHF
jgi:hypothetical protein